MEVFQELEIWGWLGTRHQIKTPDASVSVLLMNLATKFKYFLSGKKQYLHTIVGGKYERSREGCVRWRAMETKGERAGRAATCTRRNRDNRKAGGKCIVVGGEGKEDLKV